ncbi:MAG: hypothetical protein AVDCRST_MAG77-1997, partial [uncultured Chloroflexi bacterium]
GSRRGRGGGRGRTASHAGAHGERLGERATAVGRHLSDDRL